jgi:hypothetical protein
VLQQFVCDPSWPVRRARLLAPIAAAEQRNKPVGQLQIKSDLHIGGELQHPRVEGDLGITTGEIKLDPILALMGESAYATKPTEYAGGPGSRSGGANPAGPGSLQMDVHLTAPRRRGHADRFVSAGAEQRRRSPLSLQFLAPWNL